MLDGDGHGNNIDGGTGVANRHRHQLLNNHIGDVVAWSRNIIHRIAGSVGIGTEGYKEHW